MYVAKKHENSKDKVTWDGDPEPLVRSITSSKKEAYPLLRGIALYEDTYFNSQQIKELVNELQEFKKTLLNQDQKDEIENLIKFAESVSLQEYLVFVGD